MCTCSVLPTDELLVTSVMKLALERIVVEKGAFLHQEESCCRAPVADLKVHSGEGANRQCAASRVQREF